MMVWTVKRVLTMARSITWFSEYAIKMGYYEIIKGMPKKEAKNFLYYRYLEYLEEIDTIERRYE